MMPPSPMRPLAALLILLALWAALYLPGLGEPELRGEEGRRILPAREMLRRGEFVVPYSEGRPYHRKPPGINWAIAGVFQLTGVQNDGTARIPSVLGLLGLTVAGWWAGRRLGGPQMAWALALAVLINAGMMEKARLAEIESLYVSLAGIGMFCWIGAWARGASVGWCWMATVIPFLLANLTKGPVYLIFFYAFVIPTLYRTRRLRDLWHPAHFLSLALALAPMIYWGYLVQQRVAGLPVLPPVVDEDGNTVVMRNPGDVWWQQIAGRLKFTNIDYGDWLALPWRVLIMFAPWPVFAAWQAWRDRREPSAAEDRLGHLRKALGWGSLLSCGAFCLLPSTRARFVMSALAPVCAWSVLTLFAPHARDWRSRPVLLSLLSLAALVAPWCLGLAAPLLAFGLNAVGLCMAWLAWTSLRKTAAPLRLFVLTVPPMLLLVLVLNSTVLPYLRARENTRLPAEQILAQATQPGIIAAVSPGPQPFLFYLGQRCVEVAKIADLPPDTRYIVLKANSWANEEMKSKLATRGFTQALTKVLDGRYPPGDEHSYLLIGQP